MGSCSALRQKGVQLNVQQKLSIAHDVLLSLIAMHGKSYAHRDLHDGNILVHRFKNGSYSAGLVDFGRTLHMFAKSRKTPQGASRRNPPEVLLIPMKKVSKKASDIYALGCFFFNLFFEREYDGATVFNVHEVPNMSEQEKKKIYALVKEKYAAECELFQTLICSKAGNESGETTIDTFENVIFRMIHPDPDARISLKEVAFILEKVIENRQIQSSCANT